MAVRCRIEALQLLVLFSSYVHVSVVAGNVKRMWWQNAVLAQVTYSPLLQSWWVCQQKSSQFQGDSVLTLLGASSDKHLCASNMDLVTLLHADVGPRNCDILTVVLCDRPRCSHCEAKSCSQLSFCTVCAIWRWEERHYEAEIWI